MTGSTETCPTCQRRLPKPKTETSPTSKAIQARLPYEEAGDVDAALDALIEYCEVKDKYPKGRMIQALVILGGSQREELRRWFTRRDS
jgi:hypothetical protein